MKQKNKGERKNIVAKTFIVFAVFIFFFIMGGFVSASGIATPYHDDRPLRMAAGETKVVTLVLQNNVGTEDLSFSVELTKGREVASLLGGEQIYSVPLGVVDVPVEVEVSLPEGAEIGQVYKVELTLKEISPGQGFVQLAVGFVTGFPVEVVSFDNSAVRNDPITPGFPWAILIIVVLLAIIILVFLLKHKPRK